MSRPAPRFRCGSLVSSLGAGSLRFRRRGPMPSSRTFRTAGRLGWQHPLSLQLYLGDGKLKASSRPPNLVGTTRSTEGLTTGDAGKCSSAPHSQWEIVRLSGWGGAGSGLDRKRAVGSTGRSVLGRRSFRRSFRRSTWGPSKN